MPGKKTVITRTEEQLPVEVPQLQPEKPAEVEQEYEPDFGAFLAEIGEDLSRVSVYRIQQGMPRPVYLTTSAAEGFTLDWLQKEYGEGRYALRFLNGSGQFLKQTSVCVGPAPKSAAPPPEVLSRSTDLSSLQVEVLREELKSQREILIRLIEREPNKGAGSVTELAGIIELVRGMVAPPSATTMISDMVNVLKTGIELGSTGGKPETSLLDLVKDGLQALPGVFAMLKSRSSSSAQQPLSLQTDAPADPQARAVEMLRAGILYLKSRVRANHPVGHWIDSILLNLDDPNFSCFAQFINWPWQKFAELDPEIETPLYKPWFEQLFEGLKNALLERDNPERGAGNGGNAP